MKTFVTISLCFLGLSLFADSLKGKVVRVADGDTITVLDGGNTQHKIRLNRIDAPEKKQAFGEASRKHLAGMVAGKEVKVEWEKKDKNGRILGEVYVASTNANLQMVKVGLFCHTCNFTKGGK